MSISDRKLFHREAHKGDEDKKNVIARRPQADVAISDLMATFDIEIATVAALPRNDNLRVLCVLRG